MRPAAILVLLSVLTFPATLSRATEVRAPVPLVSADASTRAVVERVTNAFGGPARLARVRSIFDVVKTIEKGKDGTRESTRTSLYVPPGHAWMKLNSSRSATMVVTPFDSWVKGPDIPNDAAMRMPDDMRQELLRRLDVDPLFVLVRRNTATVRFALGERATVAGRAADTIHVRANYSDSVWSVDAETGRLLTIRVGEVSTEYSDWKQVDGISVPFRIVSTAPSGDTRTMIVSRCEFDMPYDERTLFGTPLAWFDPELDLSKTFDPYVYFRSLYSSYYYRWSGW